MVFAALHEKQRAGKDQYSPNRKDKVKGKSIAFQGTEVYTKQGHKFRISHTEQALLAAWRKRWGLPRLTPSSLCKTMVIRPVNFCENFTWTRNSGLCQDIYRKVQSDFLRVREGFLVLA